MTPNPKNGLVHVVDRQVDPKTGAVTHHNMWPVDVHETFLRGGVLKADGKARYVLGEHYVEPVAVVEAPEPVVTAAK